MAIKSLIRKLILGHKSDSESFVNYYRKLGTKIGERTIIFEPTKTFIDVTRPFLVEIGDDVQITRGVTILTHGYDWSVLKGVYGEVSGSAGKVKIGNNVFIGTNATILKGVTVGNNVVIGANSLVNKDVPDNSVYAGNPAKFICTIEDYYVKRQQEQLKEAEEIYTNYVACYGKEPQADIFNEFFWLFHRRNEPLLPEFEWQIKTNSNYSYSMEKFMASEPEFDGYEAFLQHMRKLIQCEEKAQN